MAFLSPMSHFTHLQRQSILLISLFTNLWKEKVVVITLSFIIIAATTATLNAGEKDSQTTAKLLAADLVEDNQPINIQHSKYQALFEELIVDHQFTRKELDQLFQEVTINRKVLRLMDKQWEAKPYHEYRPRFVTPKVISRGKRYLLKHRELFDQIESKIGVNREVVVAIWAVESRFGKNTGGYNMFRTLNTLFDAYPRRSDFFRKELINYLLLCRANDLDPLSVKGSYAGAFGQAQFMPSSYNAYAIDFDGDNKINLISSLPDIFGSIANYLKTFGWIFDAPIYNEIGGDLNSVKLIQVYNKGRKGRVDWRYVATTQNVTLPRPPNNAELSIIGLQLGPKEGNMMRYAAGYPNFHAITEYNHSHKYAMAVSELTFALSN